jgi:ATP-dependent Lhr-like helicase
VATLSEDFALPPQELELALLGLQAEGYAMLMGSGAETPGAERAWCERRLLARIHRYSRERRRRATRPVSPAAYMRFLLEWHGLGEPAGELEQALAQLEGWAAPACAWEQGLLAARCADYSSQRFDEQFLSGYLTWFRPDVAGSTAQQLVAATPIAVVPRPRMQAWCASRGEQTGSLGGVAQRTWEVLQQGGAMFTLELAQRTGLMQTQLEQGLAELVAQGRVSADAFSPLRWLIRPESEKHRIQKKLGRRRGGGPGGPGTGLLGRWSVLHDNHSVNPGAAADELFPDQARLAVICEALLLRYGVVFRAVLERESLLPPWRFVLRYLRRMEDRGEVHGGRFVDGFSGEQFALPEAVGLLRGKEGHARDRHLAVINAADPLNLGGIITPGVKTAARPGSRVLLLNGVPAARIQGDDLELLGNGREFTSAEAERYLRSIHHFPGAAAAGVR